MNEEKVQEILADSEVEMAAAIEYLDESLAHIRAGKANARILDGVRVEYYGGLVPIANVATVTTPDAKTITIQPWEKGMIGPIEKALLNSDVGITPMNNGELIRLSIPPLTEDRRKQLVKTSHGYGEDAKISVRNVRRDANEQFKKLVKAGLPEDIGKDAEASSQKLHDKFIKKIEELLANKEKEILTV